MPKPPTTENSRPTWHKPGNVPGRQEWRVDKPNKLASRNTGKKALHRIDGPAQITPGLVAFTVGWWVSNRRVALVWILLGVSTPIFEDFTKKKRKE